MHNKIKHNVKVAGITIVKQTGSKTSPRPTTFGIDKLDGDSFERASSIITTCITFLREQKAQEQEGIFRKAGSEKRIKELVSQVEKQGSLTLQPTEDIHVVASLLKRYLREMREPLISFALYSTFVAAVGEIDMSVKNHNIKTAITCLPHYNFIILQTIMTYLHDLSLNSAQTLMDSKNLAIVFGPNILRPKIETPITLITDAGHVAEVVSLIIENTSLYFKPPDKVDDVQLTAFKKIMRRNYSNHSLNALQALKKAKEMNQEGEFIPKLELIGKKIKNGDRKTVQHFFDKEVISSPPNIQLLTKRQTDVNVISVPTMAARPRLTRKLTDRKVALDTVFTSVTQGSTDDGSDVSAEEDSSRQNTPRTDQQLEVISIPLASSPRKTSTGSKSVTTSPAIEQIPQVVIKRTASSENLKQKSQKPVRRAQTEVSKPEDDEVDENELVHREMALLVEGLNVDEEPIEDEGVEELNKLKITLMRELYS